MRTQLVVERFSDMITRQYGCAVKYHDLLDPSDLPDKETLELIRRNKLSKAVIQKDDLLIPIEKDECLYGMIRIKGALPLGPDSIDKMQILADMLVKSVVISEAKKQILEKLEEYLSMQLKTDEAASYGSLETQNKEFKSQIAMGQMLAEQKTPIMILGKTGAAADELAKEIHEGSSCLELKNISDIDPALTTTADGLISLGNITLFVPELSDLSFDTQLGIESYLLLTSKPKRAPRIIAASTKDLKKQISEGTVRQTLVFELSRARITMPPLEDRREDILGLIHFFSKTHSEGKRDLSSYGLETLTKLVEYRWLGNEAELENEIIQAMKDAGPEIGLACLSEKVVGSHDYALLKIVSSQASLASALKSLEAKIIQNSLAENSGNKSKVSRYLGLSRSALHQKISELGII